MLLVGSFKAISTPIKPMARSVTPIQEAQKRVRPSTFLN
jgi:hypothetical protein